MRVLRREVLERIRVRGPMAEGQAVLRRMHEKGWRSLRVGPAPTRQKYCLSATRYEFILERPAGLIKEDDDA